MSNHSNESIIKLEPTGDVLTELVRESAVKILQAALELEVSEVLAHFEARKLPDGRHPHQ